MNRIRTTKTPSTFFANATFALAAAGVWLATPAWADPFAFSTGTPDGRLGALSQPASAGHLETETADDFILTGTTSIAQATIVGLIPSGTPLAQISNVEVEVYHVFPKDSGDASGKVPMRNNSPGDSRSAPPRATGAWEHSRSRPVS